MEILTKIMFVDYQSLTVVILVSTFGLLLVALGKDIIINGIVPVVHNPISSVGNNYYCESATWYNGNSATYYFNDTLWDGAGCVDNCCDDTIQPWFYHQLNQTTQDDIEARICAADSFSYGSTLLDQLELYIQ